MQYTRQTKSELRVKRLEVVQRNSSTEFSKKTKKKKRKKLKLLYPKRSWGHMNLTQRTKESQKPAEIPGRGSIKVATY